MIYPSYYDDPGIRAICHDVAGENGEEKQQAAISTIADYFINSGILDNDCAIIPVPQHTGKAEYTKRIAETVCAGTGAELYDIVKCEQHMKRYWQKKLGFDEPAKYSLSGHVPDDKALFLLDNVIGTGTTYRDICKKLWINPIPLVYGIDYGIIKDMFPIGSIGNYVIGCEDGRYFVKRSF